MAQPFPPQGEQQQYTERPLKIYGEQYFLNGTLPMGVRTTGPNGEIIAPYILTPLGVYQPVRETDWIISNRYTGAVVEVISAEEFSERFGGGGGPNPLPE